MIKINLLVARKEKKKVGLRNEITVSIITMVLVLGGIIFVYWDAAKEKEETLAKISQTQKEITHLKALTLEVKKAKETQKILEEKLNVINSLRKDKAGPAKVLDELSIDKPEKVHLDSLNKEGSKLKIEGIALDDETIANFMTNLRKSNMFKNIDLVVSEQTELSKIKLKKFTLLCDVVMM